MKARALLALPLVAFVMSCGGESPRAGSEPLPAPGPTAGLPPDEHVAAKVYDPDYAVPEGFFVDERRSTAQSYTVHHVLDETGSYELCTDDFDVAFAWESADNASRSVAGYYVGAYENDRYFEFVRELSYDSDIGNVGEPTSPGFARVFKCSNTNRDGVDRSQSSGFAGLLNVRPLATSEVRRFVEYLWPFSYFPQRYRKVLASESVDAPGGPAHRLLLAFASGQGERRCDRIDVMQWLFVAESESGKMRSELAVLRSFEAEVIDGSPRLCE